MPAQFAHIGNPATSIGLLAAEAGKTVNDMLSPP
jgi:hypothetical protein